VVLFPPCPPSSLCPRRTSSSPSSWCTVLITHLGFEHLSMESALFLFLVFGHVWSLSHLDCHDCYGSTVRSFSRHVEFTSHEGRNGGHFWPDDSFQLRGLTPFWVVGLPWFIRAPPSPHELRGWLDFYRCGVGLSPGGAVAVGALIWLGALGTRLGEGAAWISFVGIA